MWPVQSGHMNMEIKINAMVLEVGKEFFGLSTRMTLTKGEP
jgi:hypothetical protein